MTPFDVNVLSSLIYAPLYKNSIPIFNEILNKEVSKSSSEYLIVNYNYFAEIIIIRSGAKLKMQTISLLSYK